VFSVPVNIEHYIMYAYVCVACSICVHVCSVHIMCLYVCVSVCMSELLCM